MKYTKLGNSDLKVSKVCMGCMGFGDPTNGVHTWTLPEKESLEVIKNGLDNWINFYDTAIGYQNGTSEQYVGKAVREYASREDVVVATNFCQGLKRTLKIRLKLKIIRHNQKVAQIINPLKIQMMAIPHMI